MMIQMALLSDVPCLTCSPSSASGRTSLSAIQISRTPPTNLRNGTPSRRVVMVMSPMRRPTAPAVPKMRP